MYKRIKKKCKVVQEYDMCKKYGNKLLSFHQETFNELYKMDSLVQITRRTCESIEFSGQYYGVPKETIALLSAERNNLINMLEILSDQISNIINIGLLMEDEILTTIEHQRLQLTDSSSKFRI